jgi:hypothetical protein
MMENPRNQHYLFAHRALPSIARQDHKQMFGALLSGSRDEFLRDLWNYVGEQLPEEDRLQPAGLRCSFHRHEGHAIFLVTMPPPAAMPEAHFTALVFGPFTEGSAEKLDEIPFRYLTLEKSHDFSTGGETTMLCEWTEDGHHNMGDGPQPTEEAFLGAVFGLLRRARAA